MKREMSDAGLALWRAVEDAARRFPHESTDVMTVGCAGSECVVVRVHRVEADLFQQPRG